MLLQHVHYNVVKIIRGLLLPHRPVEDLPIIGGQVDQPIIEGQLLVVKGAEVFGCKGAEQESILKHAPLPRLVHQPGALLLHGLLELLNILGDPRLLAGALSRVGGGGVNTRTVPAGEILKLLFISTKC